MEIRASEVLMGGERIEERIMKMQFNRCLEGSNLVMAEKVCRRFIREFDLVNGGYNQKRVDLVPPTDSEIELSNRLGSWTKGNGWINGFLGFGVEEKVNIMRKWVISRQENDLKKEIIFD